MRPNQQGESQTSAEGYADADWLEETGTAANSSYLH